MTLSRSKRITSNREHADPVDVPTMDVPACPRCGMPYRWDQETGQRTKPPYGPCSGLKQGTLDRGSGPTPVSARKAEKRSSSVTGETLVMIPELVDWMHGKTCFLAGFKDHVCEARPDRHEIEVCHLENRSRGHGDWIVVEGEILLNCAPGCALAHDLLDRREPCRGGLERSEVEEMAAFWAAEHTDEAPGPPEHVRLKAAGELL